jgi:chlorobactene glucosyltransferase
MDRLSLLLGLLGWLLAAVWSWRCVQGLRSYRRLPRVSTCEPPPDAALASILVPARNEESNIAGCLESLLAQLYPRLEVIAVDDNSTDRTGEIIAEISGRDPRLLFTKAPPTPPGWTGKNHALDRGVRAARGEWLLFTDADTRHRPLALASAVAHASRRGLDLLSLVPRVIAPSLWERILQPPAMGYLARWFPPDRINDPGDPLAFANGQFLLLRRSAYERLGGHAAVRGAFLEDVAFARAAKRSGLRMECALGKNLVSVRMYDTLARYLRGWHRIYLHSVDRRPAALLLRALDLAALSVLPYALLICLLPPALRSGEVTGPRVLLALGPAVAVAFIGLFAGKLHSAVGESPLYAVFHPLAASTLAGVLLAAFRSALTGAPTRWR